MAKATLSLAKKENKQGEHHILVRMDITRTNRPQFKSPVTVKEEEFVDGEIFIPKRGKLNATYRESLMKKKTDIEAFVASLNAIIMSLPEEALTRKDILEVYEMVKSVNPSEISRTTIISKKREQTEANAMWDRIPMVRIDGKLYYDTGRESIMDARCGTMDGEITSTVDGTEIPTEDSQSNFGSGFGYQYGADDTIEIYMNEKWFVFEYREESE